MYCNEPTIRTKWPYHRVMHPKDADRMANSVDPDQTAPKELSDLGQHCLPRPACPNPNDHYDKNQRIMWLLIIHMSRHMTKPIMSPERPVKTQISLGVRPV